MRDPLEIAPGIYGLGSEWVNWYLVEDGGRLTAVDAGLPGFRGDLESDLESLGHSVRDVEAVVLTHSDADHTGLVPVLREGGARVLIHSGDAKTLSNPGPKSGDASPLHLLAQMWRPGLWGLTYSLVRAGGARPPRISDAETFDADGVLDVPGEPRAVHTPGHTPGHCALLFEGPGAVFVGDALCTENPITRSRGPQLMPSALNVSNEQAARSLEAIEQLDAELVLPGHGEPWPEGAAQAVAAAREAAGA